MKIFTEQINLQTKKELEIVDITDRVQEILTNFRVKNGFVIIFIPGSTGAVTTIEFEPGLLEDFPNMLERISPRDAIYEHEKRWHDGNGHSHVRASLIGPSLTIPFNNSKLILGTWQQIVFVELDVRPRSRQLYIQVVGE
jgi:secondary thiamine-phosphate synthase enzyme